MIPLHHDWHCKKKQSNILITYYVVHVFGDGLITEEHPDFKEIIQKGSL